MKVVLVTVAVVSVLGAGGLAGAAMSMSQPSAPAGVEAPAERKADHHAAQGAFVTEKKSWTDCVAEASPRHEGPGGFDPEAACGDKPHPHDQREPGGHSDEARRDDRAVGRPAWAGGPDRRTAEPPGHAARDRAAARR